LSGVALTRDLAGGTPPGQSRRHAARALRITRDAYRSAIARSLERLVTLAQSPSCRLDPVPVSRQQVREARELMQWVAGRLRAPAPVNPRGMAILCDLLTDGSSPCYSRAAPGALTKVLESAVRGLEVED
jgi:hypothetical protein